MIDEFLALVQLKFFARPLYPRKKGNADVERCYELLQLTSRSFATVTEQLHPELRDAVMIFYLVLRGLDTIEDDVGLDKKVKLPLLRSFKSVLKHKDWTFNDSSPSERDAVVLREFDVVLRVFHDLKDDYQDIIAYITGLMGNGMADYVSKETPENYEGVPTIKDYDLYCHHVAGIVGEGLTYMALVARFATPDLQDKPELYESMGLFLQKTNIIRDFQEDIAEGRSFWPKEVWSKYVKAGPDSTGDLRDLVNEENEAQALACISELTLHSLRHVPHVLEYLDKVKEPSMFRFCAIPQVMSIATLELVFRNPQVFRKVVKIRKGVAAQLILEAKTMDQVYAIFREFTRKIHEKNKVEDPNFLKVEIACAKIEEYINAHDPEFIKDHPPNPPKESWEGAMVILVAFVTLSSLFGVMLGVAKMFGAEFVSPREIIQTQIDFFMS